MKTLLSIHGKYYPSKTGRTFRTHKAATHDQYYLWIDKVRFDHEI